MKFTDGRRTTGDQKSSLKLSAQVSLNIRFHVIIVLVLCKKGANHDKNSDMCWILVPQFSLEFLWGYSVKHDPLFDIALWCLPVHLDLCRPNVVRTNNRVDITFGRQNDLVLGFFFFPYVI